MPQTSELRFVVVHAMGQRIAVLDGGPRRPRGRGFCSPFSQWEMPLGRPMVKCFRFVCKNVTTIPFGKHIVGKLDSWGFWRYIQFQDQSWGLLEISKNVTIVLPNLRPSQQS